jgi:hypothetical protein
VQLRYRSAATVVFTAVAILLAFRLEFRPSASGGAPGQHVVVLEVPPGQEAAEHEETVDRIAAALQRLPEVRHVEYRLPDPGEFIEALLPRFTLLLSPAELERAGDRLTTEAIRAAVRRNRTVLDTPQALAAKQLVQHDPFNLLPIFLEKFGSGTGLEIDPTSGLLLSKDGSTILVLARPQRQPDDLHFARRLVERSRPIARDAKATLTGDYVVAVEDAALARRYVIVGIVALVLLGAVAGGLAGRARGAARSGALNASFIALLAVAIAALMLRPLPLPAVPGNAERQRERAIERRFGVTGETTVTIVSAATLDEALERTAAATARLPAGSWSAATQFIPARSQQHAAIEALRAGRDDRFSASRIEGDFRRALGENGFQEDAYDDYMNLFSQALQIDEPIPPEDFSDDSLAAVRERFLRRTPSGFDSIIRHDLK